MSSWPCLMRRVVYVFLLVVEAGASFVPIVGILSQPSAFQPNPKHNATLQNSYIAASYVKWIEASGARTVPILFNWNWDVKLKPTLEQLNGLVFAGGGAGIDPSKDEFGKVSFKIFQFAIQMRLPIWGTCLGFEQLLTYSSLVGTGSINSGYAAKLPLITVDAERLYLPLELVGRLARDRQIKSTLAAKVRSTLAEQQDQIQAGDGSGIWNFLSNETRQTLTNSTLNVTINMHHFGVAANETRVNNFWKVIALGHDRKNIGFIALAEARQYPMIAAQFHPEKNTFEYREDFDDSDFPLQKPIHSFPALKAMRELGDYFVQKILIENSKTNGGRGTVKMPAKVFNDELGFFRFPGTPVPVNTPSHGIMESYYFGTNGTNIVAIVNKMEGEALRVFSSDAAVVLSEDDHVEDSGRQSTGKTEQSKSSSSKAKGKPSATLLGSRIDWGERGSSGRVVEEAEDLVWQ
ncbi:unnamed protein product [Amoebophrya sp. A120]|nr:unnamed protein product [Amoebophrya sp. A120]|eukprot:GSA120T00010369001.1